MPTLLETVFEARDAADKAFEDYASPLYAENRALTDDENAKLAELRTAQELANARVLDVEKGARDAALIEEARKRLLPNGTSDPTIHVREARTYGEDSPNSYVADFVRASNPMWPGHSEAVGRLNQYCAEIAGEMRDPNSAEGKRAAKVIRSSIRGEGNAVAVRESVERARAFTLDTETRSGMSTGASSGGSFVTPQYFVAQYAPYRQFGRVFADAANKQPLPDYGMTIYLPSVNAAASVAAQVGENQGVSETDPTAGYLSSSLVTNAGQVVISQQLLDRAGPNFQFDKMVFDQLQRAYNVTLDQYVLTQALANAGSVTYSSGGTYITSTGALYPSIGKAKAAAVDAAGVVLPASHCFMQPINFEWYAAQADSAGRLLWVPDYAGAFNAVAAGSNGEPMAEGNTGYKLSGLPVFEDGNIPTSGGNNQIVVAHMDEVWFWEGDLVNRVIPQTFAQNLSVLLDVYAYVAVIVRYQKAVQTVTGTGVPTSPTF